MTKELSKKLCEAIVIEAYIYEYKTTCLDTGEIYWNTKDELIEDYNEYKEKAFGRLLSDCAYSRVYEVRKVYLDLAKPENFVKLLEVLHSEDYLISNDINSKSSFVEFILDVTLEYLDNDDGLSQTLKTTDWSY